MKHCRILVVEDERIIAMDLKLQLQALGYTVCNVVPTGEQALVAAETNNPSLVLMDIHLEGALDGVEAGREIYERFKIPIIFLSAYAEDSTLERAATAFPFGYLVKPVSPRELHATLQMALIRSGLQSKTAAQIDLFDRAMQAARLEVWEWQDDLEQPQVFELNRTQHLLVDNPADDLVSTFLTTIDKRDVAGVELAIRQARHNGQSFNIEFRLLPQPSGEERWMSAHGKHFGNPLGGRMIGVMQDITERRRTEIRLHQALTVFDTTVEGIVLLDSSRRVLSVNPAFSQLTGYSYADAVQWPNIDRLYKQPHSLLFLEQLQQQGAGHWQGHVRYIHKDGEVLSIWESLNVVGDQESQAGHQVIVFSDISSMIALQEHLDFMAKHDPLTHLCNRRMLHDRLEHELAQSIRRHKLVAVLLIDLDHFKNINDTLGHSNGDALLQEIAARLQSCVRASDTVARLGGDEFCIVLGDLESPSDIDQVALHLLLQIGQPVVVNEHNCYVTGSIGVAIAPNDGVDVNQLIRNADQAMYCAKNSGRNNYCFYAPFMQKAAEARMVISSGLHEALEQQQLQIMYQPIVSLESGEICKAEALMRWLHPVHGWISPSAFIPIAEECGLIGKISEWLLGEVLQQMQLWREQGHAALQVSINVSATHFLDVRNHERWLKKIVDAALSTGLLVLEITEGLLLDSSKDVQQMLASYHQAGVLIALDDFGTGYSALSYLKKYDLDFLKIDQSFVQQIAADHKDHALCEAMIVMGHKLGMQVVAEGVETPEQAAVLKAAGCDYVQGFLFSPARPASEFSGLLAKSSLSVF